MLDERGRLALLKRFYEPVCFIPNVLAFCLSKAGKKAIIYTYIYKCEGGRGKEKYSPLLLREPALRPAEVYGVAADDDEVVAFRNG